MKRAKTSTVTVKHVGSKMKKEKTLLSLTVAQAMVGGAAAAHYSLEPIGTDASGGTAGLSNAQTVSGLRWILDMLPSTGAMIVTWLIWIRRHGQTVPTILANNALPVESFAKLNDEDVLIWGSGSTPAGGTTTRTFEGSTKTQRKMQKGDQLMFSYTAAGVGTEVVSLQLMAQTFLKY